MGVRGAVPCVGIWRASAASVRAAPLSGHRSSEGIAGGRLALTIATMPAFSAGGSTGQAEAMKARSASAAGESATGCGLSWRVADSDSPKSLQSPLLRFSTMLS